MVLPPQEDVPHVIKTTDKDLKLKRKRYTVSAMIQRLFLGLLDPIIDIGFGLFLF